jgi:hypothetical protein
VLFRSPDAWEQMLITMLGLNVTLADIRPGDDSDHDGMSNLNEYLAGTYAFDPTDVFRLALVPRAGALPLLQFKVIGPRTYTVYGSTDLQTWDPIQLRVPADGPDAPSLPNYPATDVRTLQVEPVVSPGLLTSNYFFRVLVQ